MFINKIGAINAATTQPAGNPTTSSKLSFKGFEEDYGQKEEEKIKNPWDGYSAKKEIEELTGGDSFRKLSDAVRPKEVEEAGLNLIKMGREDLLSQFLENITQKPGKQNKVFANGLHGVAAFDIGFNLGSLKDADNRATAFLKSLQENPKISTAIKEIISKGAELGSQKAKQTLNANTASKFLAVA